MEFREAIHAFGGQPLTRQLLLDLLKTYKRPFDKLTELVHQKILIPVKRGIYVAGPSLRLAQPEPFLLANHLAGPSYISRESALSHWQLIPEQVYEISSVTNGPIQNVYNTGRMIQLHAPAASLLLLWPAAINT